MSRKYRKKPIVIEAVQWTGENKKEIKEFAGDDSIIYENNSDKKEHLLLDSLEGIIHVPFGHYVVKGVKGEFYPVAESAFFETYEEV